MPRSKSEVEKSFKKVAATPWKECSFCQVTVHNNDMIFHQKCASSIEQKSLFLNHGYVKNGIFYAKIDNRSKRKNNSAKPTIKPLVFMNPSTMKMLKFAKGGYVVVKTYEDEQVFRSWPSNDVSPSKILFPQRIKVATNDHVVLYDYNDFYNPAETADTICLLPDVHHEFMNSQHFIDHLAEEYDGFFIKVGMHLKVCYLGAECNLKITKINEFNSNLEDPIDLISKSCAKLRISDELSMPLLDNSNSTINHNKNKDSSILSTSEVHFSTPLSTLKTISRITEISSPFTGDFKKNRLSAYFQFVEDTGISILDLKSTNTSYKLKKSAFLGDIVGLQEQLRTLTHVMNAFVYQNVVSSGVLLSGPSGTGKSMIVETLRKEYHVPFISVESSNYSQNPNIFLTVLKRKFKESVIRSPCVVVLDDIHLYYQKENKIFQTEFIKLLDSIFKQNKVKVLIIAITNKPEFIDSALRHPERFEKEIKFTIPTSMERKEILKRKLEQINSSLSEDEITEIANSAYNYSGADLETIVNKALLKEELECILKSSEPSDCCINYGNLRECFIINKGTVMKEYVVNVPKVHWSDIGGMHHVKEELQDMVDLPLRNPEAFESSGITLAKGILLYGPPGCSKTMLAQALATESNANFINIKGPELLNQWVGESEKAVCQLFQTARSSAPCIIFFDELESLASKHDGSTSGSNVTARVLSQLLTEIDGIDLMKGVSIVAATNRPDMIHPALLRPDRFDRVIYVGLPDADTRKEILKISLGKMPLSDNVDIERMVEDTAGYTGVEVVELCEESAKQVIYRDVTSTFSVVTMQDLTNVLKISSPRITKEDIKFYEDYKAQFNT